MSLGEGMRQTPVTLGLFAHVDAGKTTLSEALLYAAGARRTFGRVDHGDTFLDTHALERQRGITIFSKLARFSTVYREVILADTPGHVDFSSEAERVMPVLDCAVLVISGTDGLQAHTLTLWSLLERYQLPVVLFVNKMDLPGMGKAAVLAQLHSQLSENCVDFGEGREAIAEAAAERDEALLETYLESGTVTDGNLRELIAGRKLFPVCFGSALKQQGIRELLCLLDTYLPNPVYGSQFAARVFKITRDPLGQRLTWLKVTGGTLKVRSLLTYVTRQGEQREEKVQQLRLYSADRFTSPETLAAGEVAAVTGLSATWAGQGLGAQGNGPEALLEPVMTYRLGLPTGIDPATVLPKLRQLEEEDPQLRLLCQDKVIHVQLMGQVQQEVFRSLVKQRFALTVTLEDPRISYRETIADTVEGVGHFEPLRHYAECHLLLQPLPRGSGLVFHSVCSPDVLEINYQRLILTHLAEKTHRGVLIGAPITDMKITLLVGKAHLKHTEGGDFRQATYRGVRQGLMQAKSVLLEPWYAFTIATPTEQIGRAISDLRAMGGQFDAPQRIGAMSRLVGKVPVAQVRDYAQTLASYTQGRGQLQLTLCGYQECHNTQAVVDRAAYDPEADVDNTPDSVFCAHGAGFRVPWNQVREHMHLESGLKEARAPVLLTRNLAAEDKALEKIMEQHLGPIRRPQYATRGEERPATEEVHIAPPKEKYIIVDGYNVIFAWEELAESARADLDAARRQLCDRLQSYAAYTKLRLVVVFDGYNRRGSSGEKTQLGPLQVVFTREGESADRYIEELAARIGSSFAVRVASSDALVQLSSFRSGVLRMSAREFQQEVQAALEEMRRNFDNQGGAL